MLRHPERADRETGAFPTERQTTCTREKNTTEIPFVRHHQNLPEEPRCSGMLVAWQWLVVGGREGQEKPTQSPSRESPGVGSPEKELVPKP